MALVHLSPELPRLTVRGHKREPSDPAAEIFSASYPSPGANHFLSIDADDAPGQLQRSHSGRPRSQSTFSQETGPKLRKSLRGLGRSRAVTSASRINKGKQGGDSSNRRASTTDADNATTEQIDSAFKKIKEQLVSKYLCPNNFGFRNNIEGMQHQRLVERNTWEGPGRDAFTTK